MQSEKQYIDLFEQHKTLINSNSCTLLNQPREEAAKAFKILGFPTKKTEEYKYTAVSDAFAPDYGVNLKRVDFPVDTYKAFKCSVPNMGTAVYFMVGDKLTPSTWVKSNPMGENIYVGNISEFPNQDLLKDYYNQLAPWQTDGIVALNTMLAQDGLLIYIKENTTIENTLQIVNLGRSEMDLMTNRRVIILLEKGAKASVLFCDHNMDSHQFLTTQVTEIYLQQGSELSICNIEETGSNNTIFDQVYVQQAENSILNAGYFTLKNGITRRTGCFQLNGNNAQANLFGGVIGDDKEHTDNNLLIEHKHENCNSDILFKYVLDDESTGAFAGKVLVHKGAQKTNSQETNANLCVSPKARMYTQPMLEIYADDVKCNHGSTIGKLDEKALFYMAGRGIPEAEATMLLQEAFLGDAIRKIPIEALRERLTHMVEQRFRHKLKKCGSCELCNTK